MGVHPPQNGGMGYELFAEMMICMFPDPLLKVFAEIILCYFPLLGFKGNRFHWAYYYFFQGGNIAHGSIWACTKMLHLWKGTWKISLMLKVHPPPTSMMHLREETWKISFLWGPPMLVRDGLTFNGLVETTTEPTKSLYESLRSRMTGNHQGKRHPHPLNSASPKGNLRVR